MKSWVFVGVGVLVLGVFASACEDKASSAAEETARQAVAAAASAQAAAASAQAEVAALKAKAASAEATAAVAPASAAASAAEAPAAGTGAATEAAAGSAPVGAYPLDRVRPVPDDCADASVMLSAVPTGVVSKDDFVWAFALQAFYAHPEFRLTLRSKFWDDMHVAMQEVPVNATATALIAYCRKGSTCNQLAAMYKTTVPSSKPELYCGKQWAEGKVPTGLRNLDSVNALAKKKLEEEPTSMCARIGVCEKRLNPAAPGDPGVECQKSPTSAKYKCGQKKTCEEVVACRAE